MGSRGCVACCFWMVKPDASPTIEGAKHAKHLLIDCMSFHLAHHQIFNTSTTLEGGPRGSAVQAAYHVALWFSRPRRNTWSHRMKTSTAKNSGHTSS